jgi:hypothetical protein
MTGQADVAEAISLLQSLAGTTSERAKRLIAAVSDAGSKQALDIIGDGSVPSNLTNSRAEFLHVVTVLFGSTLSDDEVEVVFRCTKTAAKTIVGNMNATFASSIRDLRLDEMRKEATCRSSGNNANGLAWKVCFNSEVAFETAVDEIERLRRRTEATIDSVNFCVEFKQKAPNNQIDLLSALGIPPPAASKSGRARKQ